MCARGVASLAVLLSLVLALLGPGVPAVLAGADVCPEPNNDATRACFLGPSGAANGFLDTPDDVDTYRIELPPEAMLVATLGALPADYVLRLLLADGTVRAEAIEPGLRDKVLRVDGLPPGTYYLTVSSTRGQSSSVAPYVVGVSYPASLVLSAPGVPPAPAGAPSGAYGYVPGPASAYELRPGDVVGSFLVNAREASEDGRFYHLQVVAPDTRLFTSSEAPDGVPYSPTNIALIDVRIFIYPYGSNDDLGSDYDKALGVWRDQGRKIEPAVGWGSEQVFSFFSPALDKPRMVDRGIALKHHNAAVIIEMVGLEQFATWDSISHLMQAVESRIHAAAQ